MSRRRCAAFILAAGVVLGSVPSVAMPSAARAAGALAAGTDPGPPPAAVPGPITQTEPCLFAHGGLDAGDEGFERVSQCLRRPTRLSFATFPNYEGCTGPVKLTRITWSTWTSSYAVGKAVDVGMQGWCRLSVSAQSVTKRGRIARVRLDRPQVWCGQVYFSGIRVGGRNKRGQKLRLRNTSPWVPRC